MTFDQISSGLVLVYLIRHALTASTGKRLYGTSPGIHLSPQGQVQARRLADRMRDVPLDALYTSPLERCLETAAEVTRGRGIRPRPTSALSEVDYGTLTGRTFGSLRRLALWKEAHRTPSTVRFPGGETLAEVQVRATAALAEIAGRHTDEAVAVVTHGDVIRLALAHSLGVPLDLYQRLHVDPGSVSVISMGGGPARVLRVNDTGTLGP